MSEAKILDRFMDNVVAHRLAQAWRGTQNEMGKVGDEIDLGLILRRSLEENGFGVTDLWAKEGD